MNSLHRLCICHKQIASRGLQTPPYPWLLAPSVFL
jgi:hypothetical protein